MTTETMGIVHEEMWNGFRLVVIQMPDGFRSAVLSPWDKDARMCNTARPTLHDAKARCWGMVRQDCELKAVQAAVRMNAVNKGP
jgi:hypothetical protein